jgi:Holliday junction resolvase-like predicted endonuclease
MPKKKPLSSTGKKKHKQTEIRIKGYASQAKGLRYEQKVANYLSEKGWHNIKHRVYKYGREYDIEAKQEDFLAVAYLIVECKDKNRVSARDVISFYNRAKVYYDKLQTSMFSEPDFRAYLCYSGEIDKEAEIFLRNHKIIKTIKIR